MRFIFLSLFYCCCPALIAQKTRLDVTPVAPGYWVHTTYNEYKGTVFPANGVIVAGKNDVLIVDTGWGEKPARKLLRWVRKNLKKPVRAVFITHAHDDRAGGVSVYQEKKIPVWASDQTAALLRQAGVLLRVYNPLPADSSGKIGALSYQVYYPGAGHASDNVVFYFSDARLLFGGCFIKSLEAADLGNLADADLATWPEAIRRTQARFPDARLVIPGHQAWGGPELLDHTLKLLETRPK